MCVSQLAQYVCVKGRVVDGRYHCCYCLFFNGSFYSSAAFLFNEFESLFLTCFQEDLSNLQIELIEINFYMIINNKNTLFDSLFIKPAN